MANGEALLAELGRGDMFGETSLLDNRSRTATATTTEDSSLIKITPQQLRKRLDDADPSLEMFIQLVLQRYRSLLDTTKNLDCLSIHKEESSHFLGKLPQRLQQALDNLVLENDLRKAIEEEQFVLFYQPIIDMDSMLPAGFEALIRWQHPQHGLIAPDRFLDIAEKSGLIVRIGEWVALEACHALQRMQARFDEVMPGHSRLMMNINASGLQLVHGDFTETIDRVLRITGIEPALLKIEVTESALIGEPEQAENVLHDLQKMGVKTALDDFGTGYSSLNYLRRFPINYLKIDREFVWSMLENRVNHEIVVAVNELAHKLGMQVIAEGIESAEHMVVLKNMDVDFGQGYYFSRPQSEQDILAFLLPDERRVLAG
jgi:EAL domain-containing protein (putative c-di-GMP-specific phosphodiesterase class I)